MNSSTEEGREVLKKFHAILHKEMIAQGKIKTCINCFFFEDSLCKKFDAMPPAETIVYGCEVWEREIPF